jgi:hypothetical protein
LYAHFKNGLIKTTVFWSVTPCGLGVLEELAAATFRGQVPLKHRFLSTKLHSIMSQVRFILIFFVVRIFNLTE